MITTKSYAAHKATRDLSPHTKAYTRRLKQNVKYRFVIDMSSLS